MAFILPKNLTSMTKLFEWANVVTDGRFVSMAVIMFSLVIFMGSLGLSKSAAQSFTFGAFFGMLAAMLFGFMGLVSGQTYFIYVILLGLGIFWMRFTKEPLG